MPRVGALSEAQRVALEVLAKSPSGTATMADLRAAGVRYVRTMRILDDRGLVRLRIRAYHPTECTITEAGRARVSRRFG